jgi:PAS domain-containing protein
VATYDEPDLREMLDRAVNQSPVSIALLDTQLRQLRLNASMCRVLGLADEAAGLGLRLTDLLSNEATRSCLEAARWCGPGSPRCGEASTGCPESRAITP